MSLIHLILFTLLYALSLTACDEPEPNLDKPCQGRCTGASICENNRCTFKPPVPDQTLSPDAEVDMAEPLWIDLGSVLDASLNSTAERCNTPNAVRPCIGERSERLQDCSAAFQRCEQNYWSVCQSGQELCNALDDDCDGNTDEGFELGTDCSLGKGQCVGSGVLACNEQGEAYCTALPLPAERESCDAIDNDCDGQVDEDFQQLGRICNVGLGECMQQGQYICDSIGEVRCSVVPLEASEERCDFLDNDCDGQIDEADQQVGELCQSDYLGECETGQLKCLNGSLFCEPVQGPQQERCDLLDNDCDGRFDEEGESIGEACISEAFGLCQVGQWLCGPQGEWLCVSTQEPQVELCDLIDNDCDGLTDENVFAENDRECTTNEQGLCAQGEKYCVAGQVQCRSTYQAQEERCDGLDNDCDGQVDESDASLGLDCNIDAFGPCAFGYTICEQGQLSCQSFNQPTDELCDQIDNDCDGELDENFPALGNRCELGLGVCARSGRLTCSTDQLTLVCIDTDAQVVFPTVELCDNLDNDCDGETDEAGWADDDPLHCGACGQQCLFARQASVCLDGQCQATICQPGWQSQEEASEPCNKLCELNETHDETCNSVDDDCDGLIDEDSCPSPWLTQQICAERAALGLNDALCLSAEQSNWVSAHRFTNTPWLVSEQSNSPWFNPDAQQLTWSDTGLTLLEGQSLGVVQRQVIAMSSTWQMDIKLKLAQSKFSLALTHQAELFPLINQGILDPINHSESLSQSGGLQLELEPRSDMGEQNNSLGYIIRILSSIDEALLYEQSQTTGLSDNEISLRLSKNQAGNLALRNDQGSLLTPEQAISLSPTLARLDQLSIAISPASQVQSSSENTELRLLSLRYDNDQDNIYPPIDNCPEVFNPEQFDRDQNGIGRACDDRDQDLYEGGDDLCPLIPTNSQADQNQNGRGDLCEGLGAVVIALDSWSGPWAKVLDLETGQRLASPIPVDNAFNQVSYSPSHAWWSHNNIIGLLSFASAEDTELWWQQSLNQVPLVPYDLSGSAAFIDQYLYYVSSDQRTILRYDPSQALVPPEAVYQGSIEDWLIIHASQDRELIVERDREGASSLFSLNTEGEVLYQELSIPRQGQRLSLARRSRQPSGYLINGTEGILQGLLLVREESGDFESYDEEPVQWFATTPPPKNSQNQLLSERGGGLIFRKNPLYPYRENEFSQGLDSTVFWAADLSLGRANWRALSALDHDFSAARFSTVAYLTKYSDQDHDGIPDNQDNCPNETSFALNETQADLVFAVDQSIYRGLFDLDDFTLSKSGNTIELNIWDGQAWSNFPLPSKTQAAVGLVSSYEENSVQLISCSGSKWLSVIDYYDGELSLFELSQTNEVLSLPEDVRTRFQLPFSLGADYDTPEYPLSPIYFSCNGQELSLKQVWLESRVNPTFNTTEPTHALSQVVIDLEQDQLVPSQEQFILAGELRDDWPISQDLLGKRQRHLSLGQGQWVSLIVTEEGALFFEQWSETEASTEVVTLLPESFRRQHAQLFAEVTENQKLVIALQYEDESIWLSPPLGLNDLQQAQLPLRRVSQYVEDISTVRLASSHHQSILSFVGKYPGDSAKAVFLSVMTKDQKIAGQLWKLSAAKSSQLGLSHLNVEGRNLKAAWYDQSGTWEYVGALPCP